MKTPLRRISLGCQKLADLLVPPVPQLSPDPLPKSRRRSRAAG